MPKKAKKRRKRWSVKITEGGVTLTVFERAGGACWYEYSTGRKVRNGAGSLVWERVRGSLKTSDREVAKVRAKATAKEMDRLRINPTQGDVTLAQVFGLYGRDKLATLKAENDGEPTAWTKAAETRMGLFLQKWGGDTLVAAIDQHDVDAFTAARMAGTLSPLEGATGPGARKPQKVRAGTVDADFRWLSSVFNFACSKKDKATGRRVLTENPLHDCDWKKETQPRQPVASHERYTRTQEHADAVDPAGRLRCILALARFSGRRESAVCGLRASDLLFTEDRVREALAAAGMNEATRDGRCVQCGDPRGVPVCRECGAHNEGIPLYPYGAIHWSPELDKQKLVHITPIARETRAEVDAYLRKSALVGDVPLFPAPEDPAESIRRDVAARWLLTAEKAAGLPKLKGGVFHPYRRLWATERKHHSDIDVAAAGGWSDTRALKLSYQHASPADVLRVVNGA